MNEWNERMFITEYRWRARLQVTRVWRSRAIILIPQRRNASTRSNSCTPQTVKKRDTREPIYNVWGISRHEYICISLSRRNFKKVVTTEAVFLKLTSGIYIPVAFSLVESDKHSNENYHKVVRSLESQRTIDHAYIYSFKLSLSFTCPKSTNPTIVFFFFVFQRLTNTENIRGKRNRPCRRAQQGEGAIVNRNFFPRRASPLESINAILDVLFHANSPLSVTVTI